MSLAVTTQVGSARCSRMKESAELANGQPLPGAPTRKSKREEQYVAKSEALEPPAQPPDDEDHSPGFLRRFLALAVPFFNSEERWTARLLALGVLGLTLLQIGIAIG